MTNNVPLKNQSYRAMIPFEILYDLSLTTLHLRLYGLIEQLESNNKTPFFSLKWFAEKMGKSKERIKTIARELRKKGYINREDDGKYWVWSIARNKVKITKEMSDLADPYQDENNLRTELKQDSEQGGGCETTHIQTTSSLQIIKNRRANNLSDLCTPEPDPRTYARACLIAICIERSINYTEGELEHMIVGIGESLKTNKLGYSVTQGINGIMSLIREGRFINPLGDFKE